MSTLGDIIPQEYKDKAYLSDIKELPAGPDGYSALFKKLDGAQTLIGKKTIGIPGDDSPEEERAKFYSALRPAKPEEYELPAPAEGQQPDVESQKAIRQMLHDAGLSKTQAKGLLTKFDAHLAAKMAPVMEQQAKLDAEFNKLTQEAFGAETPAVMARSKELLENLTPTNLKPHLPRLSNEALIVLAGVMEQVRARYMKESDPGGGKPPQGGGVSAAELREEAVKLMQSPDYRDPSSRKHAEVVGRIKAIYDQVAAIPQ